MSDTPMPWDIPGAPQPSDYLHTPKIYVASSWRNIFQGAVVEVLRAAKFDVYDFKNPPTGTGFLVDLIKWLDGQGRNEMFGPHELALMFEANVTMTPADIAWEVEHMLQQLHSDVDRIKARALIRRRLAHPEVVGLSSGPPHIETEQRIHPKAGTHLAAHDGGPMCVCGAARSRHDIDGLRDDCDGYVEA